MAGANSAVTIDVSELEALADAIKTSAVQVARDNHPLAEGLVDDTRLRQAQKHAFNNIVKETRKPIRQVMASGGPGTRLRKPTAYTIGTRPLKKGTRNPGMPYVKAGKFGKTGTKLAGQVGVFSGFVHHGTRERRTRDGQDRGRIVGTEWMYRRQGWARKLFEKEFVKNGERFLVEFWEKKTQQIAKRSAGQAAHSASVRAGRKHIPQEPRWRQGKGMTAEQWVAKHR